MQSFGTRIWFTDTAMKAKGKVWWGNSCLTEAKWTSSLVLHVSAEQYIVSQVLGIQVRERDHVVVTESTRWRGACVPDSQHVYPSAPAPVTTQRERRGTGETIRERTRLKVPAFEPYRQSRQAAYLQVQFIDGSTLQGIYQNSITSLV
jgi:hypothetical protein